MKANEYKCAMCHNIYEKGWSDEEAKQECVDNFGKDLAAVSGVIVCDDCYALINPKDHPDKVEAAKKELNDQQ